MLRTLASPWRAAARRLNYGSHILYSLDHAQILRQLLHSTSSTVDALATYARNAGASLRHCDLTLDSKNAGLHMDILSLELKAANKTIDKDHWTILHIVANVAQYGELSKVFVARALNSIATDKLCEEYRYILLEAVALSGSLELFDQISSGCVMTTKISDLRVAVYSRHNRTLLGAGVDSNTLLSRHTIFVLGELGILVESDDGSSIHMDTGDKIIEIKSKGLVLAGLCGIVKRRCLRSEPINFENLTRRKRLSIAAEVVGIPGCQDGVMQLIAGEPRAWSGTSGPRMAGLLEASLKLHASSNDFDLLWREFDDAASMASSVSQKGFLIEAITKMSRVGAAEVDKRIRQLLQGHNLEEFDLSTVLSLLEFYVSLKNVPMYSTMEAQVTKHPRPLDFTSKSRLHQARLRGAIKTGDVSKAAQIFNEVSSMNEPALLDEGVLASLSVLLQRNARFDEMETVFKYCLTYSRCSHMMYCVMMDNAVSKEDWKTANSILTNLTKGPFMLQQGLESYLAAWMSKSSSSEIPLDLQRDEFHTRIRELYHHQSGVLGEQLRRAAT